MKDCDEPRPFWPDGYDEWPTIQGIGSAFTLAEGAGGGGVTAIEWAELGLLIAVSGLAITAAICLGWMVKVDVREGREHRRFVRQHEEFMRQHHERMARREMEMRQQIEFYAHG